MSAAELIRAAIERLELQRDTATPAPWTNVWGSATVPAADDLGSEDAELIVTLHRTIDPQLAILREVEYQLGPDGHGHAAQEFNLYVPLARAILGEDTE